MLCALEPSGTGGIWNEVGARGTASARQEKRTRRDRRLQGNGASSASSLAGVERRRGRDRRRPDRDYQPNRRKGLRAE